MNFLPCDLHMLINVPLNTSACIRNNNKFFFEHTLQTTMTWTMSGAPISSGPQEEDNLEGGEGISEGLERDEVIMALQNQ